MPAKSLATVSDRGQPDLDNLKLLLEGFMTGALRPEAGEQRAPSRALPGGVDVVW
jgi:hypothetical protein